LAAVSLFEELVLVLELDAPESELFEEEPESGDDFVSFEPPSDDEDEEPLPERRLSVR
jgi:hypothetical protein